MNYKKTIGKVLSKKHSRGSSFRNIIKFFFAKHPRYEKEYNKMIVDYPWNCSLEVLSELDSIKLDEIHIQCSFVNRNSPNVEYRHDNQNIKSFLVTIHKSLPDIVKDWFKRDTIIESINKTVIYQFFYWIKENSIAKIMTDIIISSLGKRKYKIQFNSESFSIYTLDDLSNEDIECILSQLKLLNFINRKWMRECIISIDRIFQNVHLSPHFRQSKIVNSVVYKLKICLNTKQLYDMDTTEVQDFSTDIYALHDIIFKS